MRPLRAFAIGFVAFVVVGFAAAAAVGITADIRGWSSFELVLGPLSVLTFERDSTGSAFTVGSGIVALAAVGGLLNALAATAFGRRAVRVHSEP